MENTKDTSKLYTELESQTAKLKKIKNINDVIQALDEDKATLIDMENSFYSSKNSLYLRNEFNSYPSDTSIPKG